MDGVTSVCVANYKYFEKGRLIIVANGKETDILGRNH